MSRDSDSIHGVLVSVAGRGVLLLGESGTGKSDLALELVAAGHSLVADDVVVLSRSENAVFGSAPERFAGLIMISGLGIFDVRTIFGTSGYRESSPIDVCIVLDEQGHGDVVADRDMMSVGGILIPFFRFSGGQRRNLRLLVETTVKLIDSAEDMSSGRIVQEQEKFLATACGERYGKKEG